jgi:threonine/homoserine/homoserine lactone efflux protein
VAKRSLATHGVQFVRHVVPQLVRPIRSLWHEVIGFLFLSLAFLAAVSGFRVARNLEDPANMFRLIITVIFALIMAGFGISSFLRARKISRS